MTAPARSRDLSYRSHRSRLSYLFAALLLFLSALFAAPLSAHDIPADVLMQVFLKPEGQRLHVVVRAPMSAMRDVDFPMSGPGYLELDRVDPFLAQAANLWIANSLAIFEGQTRLAAPRLAAARISLPSDRSFSSYDEAVAHLRAPPLDAGTQLIWNQGWLDVELEFTIASDRAKFSINPTFARLGVRTVTALRFLPPDGGVSAFELVGDPGLVRIDPEWYQAAWRFVALGFEHILSGTDHLLFLFCLVIPFRKLRQLVVIVTSFTVAHSVTLIGSAFGIAPDALWFPPLIETLIAVSIVYMALENIVIAADGAPSSLHARGAPPPRAAAPAHADSLSSRQPRALKHRWLITFAFGLVHGFGFSFALRQTLQFAGAHMLSSLLAFNVGVEIGQLLVLVVLLPGLALLFRYVVVEKLGIILLSALVGHTAWHWMLDRADALSAFQWPAFDAATAAAAIRWLMVALVLAAGWRVVSGRRRREKMAPGRDDAGSRFAQESDQP